MSRMFDEMPEELKMLLAGALFGGISPPPILTGRKKMTLTGKIHL